MTKTPRTPLGAVLLASCVLAGSADTVAAQPAVAGPTCDEACLTKAMGDFVTAMTTAQADAVPLGSEAEIRENAKIVALRDTTWGKVKVVRSRWTFADALTGNVVLRAGVELADGKPGYLSTRLKIAGGGRISDVEISADTSSRVVGAYVWGLDPAFPAVLPPEQRSTRVQLEALARRYFASLSSHQATAADFDAGCNRFHSGQQITNAGQNSVEGGAARTCASSLEGNPPWGPATDQRFPVIDPDRGIVFAVTLLHYLNSPQPSQMYVSEVFKVVSGRIVRIDNIGLMMRGTTSLGFVH